MDEDAGPRGHAERAVRAGLELIRAVSGLKPSAPLQIRVGIATGLVVVGDLIGSGEAQERGIVGETPNLAARLQGLAEPNSVVLAESTRKLLGNLFELEFGTKGSPSEAFDTDQTGRRGLAPLAVGVRINAVRT
jgi:class 3 adenylate cyclase